MVTYRPRSSSRKLPPVATAAARIGRFYGINTTNTQTFVPMETFNSLYEILHIPILHKPSF